ncbi:TonB-dependent receptor, partial [Gammaproteobacteria bacterium]|nr:TonB-dependent receptor [Gammaproteobacteria bacterium]
MYSNKISSRRDMVLSGLALSLASLPVTAQTDDESVEEVVVLGSYAQSLKSALDRKRNADGVVDAITAEDIGKYPDTNLAESLARISGVSIDRFNGEGSRVTVRGLGPEYNLVTLNGRSMPTVGGRSFDFADISPHGIAAVEVYKTGNAAIPTGGIGATVNMVTTKPLDAPGFIGVIDASVVDAYNVTGDDFNPQIMGVFSNTFADDTIGVSLSASSQERHNREQQARVNTWLPNFRTADIDPAVWTNNNQRADGTTWYPQDADYFWADNQTERTNAQLTIQWQASEDVRATVDYTHSKRDFYGERQSIGIWFNSGSNVVNAVTNENGTFTTVSEKSNDYAANMARGGLINTNDSLGFNLEWDATDNLTVTFDAHDSTAEGKGQPGVGSNTFLITGNTCFGDAACIDTKTATYPSSGVHIFNFTVNGKDEFEASDIGTLFGQSDDYFSENDMSQMHLSGLWENSDSDSALKSITFGYANAEQDWLNQNRSSGQLPAGWWLASADYADDAMWTKKSVGNILNDASNSGQGPTYYWGTTWDQLIAFYEGFNNNGPDDWISCCNAFSWGADYKNADGTGNINPGPIDSDARVKEETSSLYVQFDFETEF